MQMDNIGNTEHAMTFAALRVHYYTGRSYLISGEGRNKVFGVLATLKRTRKKSDRR